MKKLLLILSAILVSVITLAQTIDNNTTDLAYTLNPYAYDLSSSWDASTKKLTVRFTLNAVPNLNGDGQNSVTDGEPNGIQIYAVDPNGNRYRIGGPGRDVIQDAHVNKKGQYVLELDLSSGLTVGGKNPGQKIPDDVPLTWEVRVKGRSKRATTMTCTNAGWRPYHTHGVAVSKNKDSKHFGKIFVTEFSDTKPTNWSWLNTRVPGLLEYDPIKLTSITQADQAVGHKGGTGLEPHRVRISEDGRIFVTSYPYTSSPSQTGTSTAVWELVNGTYKPIITCEANGTGRVVAMDVKGSGPNLKMLVCELIPNQGTYPSPNAQNRGQLRIREYNIGTSTTSRGIANASRVIYYNDYRSAAGYQGMIYQAYQGKWYMATEGMVNIAYGAGNAIWLKLGFNSNAVRQRIVYFDGTNDCSTYYDTGGNTSSTGMRATQLTDTYVTGMLGGDGLLIQGDTLITAGIDKVYLFKIGSGGTLSSSTSVSTISGTFQATSNWVNDFAIDPAHNLYAVSANARNLMVVSLPYSGSVTTPAPAGNTFVLADPVPNILATDLRYDIVRGKNQYEFSFNVNTKPEEAQIRFYESYDAMKNSLNAVNADNYDGTNNNKPLFVYNIPSDELKQGRIAVKLGAVGGQADDGVINNDRLPAGVLYWSVYVKTRKSNVFAPIYRQEGTTIDTGNKDNKGNPIYDYERRHIVVNNYPETDMFGALIVAHNPSVTDDATRANRGLHIYGFNPEGNSNDEQGNINNNTRYSKRAEYLNQNADGRLHYPRRLVVGPDGKVYVADEGTATTSRTTQGGVIHEHGGVKLWDPTNPNKFTLFSDNKIGTATGVALYEHSDGWKLYANNTYNEFSSHGDAYTKEAQDNPASYGWNGFVGYVLDKYTSGHNGSWSSWGNNATEYALRRGDASGNFAFAPMEKGIWICQYREHTVALKTAIQQPLADNFEAYILSFVPYGTDIRTWKSSESIGVKYYSNGTPVWDDKISPYSQTTTAPLQSTPGGGVAYKKTNGKEYVYVVNHDGNIAVLEITGWTGTGVSATPIIPVNNIKILTTPEFTKVDREVPGTSTKWHTAFITSMCFDYAGNLVTTTGKGYHDAHQDILVYTMPYDRVNAREIQAPNSCRMIPERIAHFDMDKKDLDELIDEHQDKHPTGCAIDLYRPLQGGMFNTICLPCTLDLKTLPEGHPLYEAELKEYTGLNLNTVGGEKVLELVFTDVSGKVIIANKPYIIQPEENYNSIIRFAGPLRLTNTTGEAVDHEENSKNYNITYQGIIPYQKITPVVQDGVSLTLMLVADNRLAEMTTEGYMYGFRGYFRLNQPLPKGMRTRISTSKGTATNTTIVVDGKKVNVEKFLQEGRVYIRMGDSLYTIDGQKVE